jgi:aspartate aminotransferase-like enzyme
LESNDTPWTPAVSLVIGVDGALEMIRAEGIEQVWARHDRVGRAVRAAMHALGLKLLASSSPSNALTAVWIPDGIDARRFNKTLKDTFQITIAGGQGPLQGKIFRVAHLGYYDELDMIALISALEMTLHACGYRFEVGAGVRAVQQSYLG